MWRLTLWGQMRCDMQLTFRPSWLLSMRASTAASKQLRGRFANWMLKPLLPAWELRERSEKPSFQKRKVVPVLPAAPAVPVVPAAHLLHLLGQGLPGPGLMGWQMPKRKVPGL
mmetsp:Transcript_84687/g.203013  ORF Transcript_84687/g.203013 Transcript_84687/m.203013 type:complete len:113 (-) Transcript_84687:1938-2276(-)